jgi:hypothetical protein
MSALRTVRVRVSDITVRSADRAAALAPSIDHRLRSRLSTTALYPLVIHSPIDPNSLNHKGEGSSCGHV